MKRYFVLILGVAFWAGSSWADDTANEAPEIRGGLVQGIIGQSAFGGTAAGVNLGYTTPFGGAGISIAGGKGKLSDDFGDLLDTVNVSFGLGAHAGYQIGRVRPRINFGIGYSTSNNKALVLEVSMVTVGGGAAIDFLAGDHILFSLGLIGIDGVVGGTIDDGTGETTPSGYGVGFLNSFAIGYLF